MHKRFSTRQENLSNLNQSLRDVTYLGSISGGKFLRDMQNEIAAVAEEAKVLVGFELLALSKKSKKLAKRLIN